jgi:hypothetical protein
MSRKTWKDHLLASGVPLEHSVARIFEELGLRHPKEFRYERKNEVGIPQVFSVDIHSAHIDKERNFWLETLVECKYRHDGTKWVFTPRDYEASFGPKFAQLFVTLDQCCPDRVLDREAYTKFEDKYPLCEKGIELLPEDANPKTIEQAVRQLRYAVVANTVSAFSAQRSGALNNPGVPIFVIVPIVVTTAELWRLRTGTTVEDVRRAEGIGEVADAQGVVVLQQTPNDSDMNETRAAFSRQFDTEEEWERRRSGELGVADIERESYEGFVDSIARNTPSLFVIMRYDTVRSALATLLRFFANDSIIRLQAE